MLFLLIKVPPHVPGTTVRALKCPRNALNKVLEPTEVVLKLDNTGYYIAIWRGETFCNNLLPPGPSVVLLIGCVNFGSILCRTPADVSEGNGVRLVLGFRLTTTLRFGTIYWHKSNHMVYSLTSLIPAVSNMCTKL